MKLFVTLLCISLLIPISSFSQGTSYPKKIGDSLIVITATQLKETNLIFAEHNKLLQENSLLKDQVSLFEQSNNNLKAVDSLRLEQIKVYDQELVAKNDTIADLNKTLKKKVKRSKIKSYCLGITSVVAIIGVLFGVIK